MSEYNQENEYLCQSSQASSGNHTTNSGSALPPCCNSGCTVCVRDYPELFLDTSEMEQARQLAMLEAVEQALAQVGER